MQISQLLRRSAYAGFGVAPASYLIWIGIPVPLFMGVGALLEEACAIIGVIGLWGAMLVQLPVVHRWISVLISASLVVGILAITPWVLLFAYLAVASIFDGSAGDLSKLSAVLAYAGRAMLILWVLIGPLAVATHFLQLQRRYRHLTIGSSDRRG